MSYNLGISLIRPIYISSRSYTLSIIGSVTMNTNYRNSNQIILRILDCIIKEKSNGQNVLKTHIMQYANLKTTIAEKYLNALENAGYIKRIEDKWGKRTIIYYDITEKGTDRYKIFSEIDRELDDL
ncbi:MAG: hypothetical protein AMQ74_00546 [Candidatus Methanofastidiosum methylothiophilum]|jgi:predicted transcriptional regulator|uniref:ArnR1-like winged helix-turn-helix domain-containing protein n=1 Tax=Candidatus Methanofastidiosum methylothiophilum TaxID=1705564 RepID=A0A150J7N6_9EURY|nr:MAG: hypothetical protein AMQ74_00546 [Candidatus Methanofastidiosum methylthiophilus]NMC76411.1 hypothetical protein [Candidatus Methanofastidiosa archaeon]